METDLFKVRSLAGCIKDAYNLFSSNFSKIVRRTWVSMVAFALAMSGVLCFAMASNNGAYDAAGAYYFFTTLGGLLLCFVLALVAGIWVSANFWGLLNGLPFKLNLKRMAKLMGFGVLVEVTLGLVLGVIALFTFIRPIAHQAPTPEAIPMFVVSMAVFYIVVIVCVVPLVYSIVKYCMEPQRSVFSIFGKPYLRGWRHWGFLFAVVFVAGIITMIIYCIVFMPYFILNISYSVNQMGVNMGDASALPVYFWPALFVITAVCSFVQLYVSLWIAMVYYYAYGTIEAKHGDHQPFAKANAALETPDRPALEQANATPLPDDIKLD